MSSTNEFFYNDHRWLLAAFNNNYLRTFFLSQDKARMLKVKLNSSNQNLTSARVCVRGAHQRILQGSSQVYLQ